MGIVLPKYDFVFRALMGNEKVRRHFISDMLGIPLEQIKSLRVSNPFLWKRRNKHKLGKRLEGGGQLDDWIRLFNAKTEVELDMIKTDNPGILEAIREIKVMSLGKSLRWLYEARMKEIRDLKARDAYVRDEGIEIGRTEGRIYAIIALVRHKIRKGIYLEDIVDDMLDEDKPLVRKVYSLIKEHPEWGDEDIFKGLKTTK